MTAQQKRNKVLALVNEGHTMLAEISGDALVGDAISAQSMSGDYARFSIVAASLGVAVQDYRLTVEAAERAEDSA